VSAGDVTAIDDAMFADVGAEVVRALGGRRPTRQQWEAIGAPLEPCVLIAGAGSGKTAVMAARIVWLIVNGHAKAGEILGLTFTNKAAESLLERVRAAVAPLGLPEGEEPTILTYHAFAAGLIADYGLRAGLEPNATLLSPAQVWQLLAEIYTARTYRDMEVRSLWHVGYLKQLADDCANHLVEPEEIAAWDRAFLDKVDPNDKIAGAVKATSRKRIEFAEVIATYRDVKRERHLLDYGDQIRLAYEIAQDPQVVEDFRGRYRVALLDEYQDTNIAQMKLLQRLMPPGYPVTAVGDPDQNIYAWRGASLRNLLAFPTDFPKAGGEPAGVLPLEVNFRSGRRVLDLANALIEKIPEVRRPEKVLRAYPPLGDAEVAIFRETDQVAEAERIAGEAARAHAEGTPWGEIAILARKKRLFAPVVEVFRARDVPIEVIGLGGLLAMPEIIDVVSLLRVLDDPLNNVALARLLRGPRWRIGYRDLALIARHASVLNKDLVASLPEEVESPGDVEFSLAEALEDVVEIEGVSEEARARIARFNAELAGLREHAHLPLPDLVARVVDTLGILRELDASPLEAAPAASRNIAHFLDRIAAFEPLDGKATLGALTAWLDAVEESEEDIDADQPTQADSVKLMTIHQAKGLEYDVVFLCGLAGSKNSKIFPDTTRQANPATSQRFIPFELRGDRDVLPSFDGVLSAFTEQLKQRAREEERRLLYVAVTRARKRLVCSAATWYFPAGMNEALRFPMEPSPFWNEIRDFAEVEVLHEAEPPEENPLIGHRARRAAAWPPPARRDATERLAEAVAAARAETTPDETLFPVTTSMAAAHVPRAVSVTDLVIYQRCPKRFYWTAVRPLPRRYSPAARVGSIVHEWIERSSAGQIALIDPEEYQQERPAGVEPSRVATLKQAFERTRFAGVRPARTEQPFALVIGDAVVRGRIDAVFESADGAWEIVDWKTGIAPPEGGGPEAVQLEVYALAAQEIWAKEPAELTLTFLYLGGEEGSDEPTLRSVPARPAAEIRADLEGRLASIAAGSFEPSPGAHCSHCDFLADCPEGRAGR